MSDSHNISEHIHCIWLCEYVWCHENPTFRQFASSHEMWMRYMASNMFTIYTLPYIIFGNHTVKSSKHTYDRLSFLYASNAKETPSHTLAQWCAPFQQIMSVISFSEYKWIVYWRKACWEIVFLFAVHVFGTCTNCADTRARVCVCICLWFDAYLSVHGLYVTFFFSESIDFDSKRHRSITTTETDMLTNVLINRFMRGPNKEWKWMTTSESGWKGGRERKSGPYDNTICCWLNQCTNLLNNIDFPQKQ